AADSITRSAPGPAARKNRPFRRPAPGSSPSVPDLQLGLFAGHLRLVRLVRFQPRGVEEAPADLAVEQRPLGFPLAAVACRGGEEAEVDLEAARPSAPAAEGAATEVVTQRLLQVRVHPQRRVG